MIQVGRGREGGWSESRAGAAEVIYSNREVLVLFVFIVLVVLGVIHVWSLGIDKSGFPTHLLPQ